MQYILNTVFCVMSIIVLLNLIIQYRKKAKEKILVLGGKDDKKDERCN